jgi:hypothetical protein
MVQPVKGPQWVMCDRIKVIDPCALIFTAVHALFKADRHLPENLTQRLMNIRPGARPAPYFARFFRSLLRISLSYRMCQCNKATR